MFISNDSNNGAFLFGMGAALYALPDALKETIGQVDTLRHAQKLSPILSGDTFEYLQKSMTPETFDFITKNKKLLYNPILKKFGLATLIISGGIFLGSLLDKAINK